MAKTLYSLATIHVALVAGQAATKDAPGVEPVTREVPAGKFFQALDADQEKELTGMGAARYASEDEVDGREVMDLTVEAEQAQAVAARRGLSSPVDVSAADTRKAGGATTDTDSEIAAARQRYQELFGEAPHANMKLAGLNAKIGEREAEIAAKKSGDQGTGGLV